MVLLESCGVRQFSAFGFECRGIFANSLIKQGQPVWWWSPEDDAKELVMSREEIEAHPQSEVLKMYSYMVAPDRYSTTLQPGDDDSWFFNHSCEPNCGYVDLPGGTCQLIALRTIQPGEHIVYDYQFTETEASFHAGMKCMCGAEACQGVLTFDKYRSPSFVRTWRNYCLQHIRARIDERGWVDSRVYPALDSRLGAGCYGLRTLRPIKLNEIVVVLMGKVVTRRVIDKDEVTERGLSLSSPMTHELYQVPIGVFRTPGCVEDGHGAFPLGTETGDFINHSCDGNLGLFDSSMLIALRDIAAGEWLTLDYALFGDDATFMEFDCCCHALNCRKRVTATDWKLDEVQRRYWPYFSPFIRSTILKQNKLLNETQLLLLCDLWKGSGRKWKPETRALESCFVLS